MSIALSAHIRRCEPLVTKPLGRAHQVSGAHAGDALGLGIALFLFPGWPKIIPWQPDHTSAKILAGWPLSYALWAPTLALTAGGAWRGGVIVNIIWLAAVALALLIWRKEFDWSQPSAKIMFGMSVGLVVLLTLGVFISGG